MPFKRSSTLRLGFFSNAASTISLRLRSAAIALLKMIDKIHTGRATATPNGTKIATKSIFFFRF